MCHVEFFECITRKDPTFKKETNQYSKKKHMADSEDHQDDSSEYRIDEDTQSQSVNQLNPDDRDATESHLDGSFNHGANVTDSELDIQSRHAIDDENGADEDDLDLNSPENILGSMLENANDSSSGSRGSLGGEGNDSLANLNTELGSTSESDSAIFMIIQQMLEAVSLEKGSENEQILANLKSEYEKLNVIFVNSRSNEKKLLKKCKDLSNELAVNATKVKTALKLSQNDRSTITSLRKEIKKAWKLVESSTDKETRSRDLVTSLKTEIETQKQLLADKGITVNTAAVSSGPTNRNKLIEIQMDQEEAIRRLTKV